MAADWSIRRFGLKWKIGGSAGTDGVYGFLEGLSKVTTNTRAGLRMTVEMTGGITLSCM